MTVEQFSGWPLLALNCTSNKHGIGLVLKIKQGFDNTSVVWPFCLICTVLSIVNAAECSATEVRL